MSVSLSSHVCLSFSSHMSPSLSLHMCLSLSLLFALHLFSFQSPSLLFAPSFSLLFQNSLFLFSCSLSSLSARKSLTYLKARVHMPWPIRRWANCSLHAERICVNVLWCVAVAVALAVCCVVFVCDSWLLLPFTRACFEILTILTFVALRRESHCVTNIRDHRGK